MQNFQVAFTGEKYTNHYNYWNEQWADALRQPYIFRGNHRIVEPAGWFEKKVSIPAPQTALIRKYAGNRDMESLILLLSGLFILQERYQEGEYVVIDTPLIKGDGSLFGQGEDKVPVAIQPQPFSTIRHVLSAVNDSVIKGYNYQNFPFSVLPNAGIRGNSDTSNVMVYSASLHVPPSDKLLKQYDLVLELIMNDTDTGGIVCRFTANSSMFSDWFLENLCRHYLQIITSYADMDTATRQLNIFPEAEFDKIVAGFNNSSFNFPREQTVISLFSEQVLKTPDHTAVIYRDKKLSYRQLDALSNILARALMNDYDVTSGTRVGVMMDKSEYPVISILAIMKAEAVYVPLDPGNPRDRINYILEDAGVKVLLTDLSYMFELSEFQGKLLAVDIQLAEMTDSDALPDCMAEPAHLAYIIYTSGSTGLPRGVLIGHAGLTNVSVQHVRELKMTTDDVYLQFMSLAFDGSILDIYTALLSGAALLMPDKEIISNTATFLDYITTHKATVLTLTPSYLAALNRHPMPRVRTLISAGEAARVDDACHYAVTKDFYNGYGPSEVTVNATLYKMPAKFEANVVPIGKPGANKSIYILNDRQQLLPIGLPGEICIAGEGLAIGYLNDVVLTGTKFINDPFKPGHRMYLSGDLGRWLPDGNIEYLGRKDEQVKLNGFRVDLGEIENALSRNDQIKHSTVLLHKESEGKKELLAFFQPKEKLSIVPSLGEYFIYDPFLYESMAKDHMWVEGYMKALKDVVKDKVVLNPGTGRDMILARHCLEAGAKKVYAVEMDEDACLEAEENLVRYNLQGRIVLIKGDVTMIRLPGDIDYVVSALAGNVASSDGCIPIIRSIQKNLVKNARFIPERYTTQIAAVNMPEGSYDQGFNQLSAHYINKVFDKFGYKFDLRLCLRYFSKEYLISDNAICEDLNFNTELYVEESLPITLTINKASRLHGLALWINAFSDKELMIDSLQKTHHLPVYFPLSEKGIEVLPGDQLTFTFERKLSDNGLNPDYFIEGCINGVNCITRVSYASYNHRECYDQDSFYRKFFDESWNPRLLPGITESSLKAFLLKQLPAYMVPSRFIKMSEFPVTRNGKVDKEALIDIFHELPEEHIAQNPLLNEMEERLVRIMKQVLGRKHVGVSDDFFKIGGDSIKAIQIASRMHQEGFKMEVKHLFATPVIADLALTVAPLIKIADQTPVKGIIPFSPIQYELFRPGVKDPHHYNQAVMFFNPARLNGKVVTDIFNKIYEHHDLLRATFDLRATTPQQFNAEPYQFYITEMDIPGDQNGLQQLESEANRLQVSIDLKAGPLMKVGLFHMPDGDRLLVIVHHLVIDTVSWRILFEDISILLQQHNAAADYQLPLKTTSFKEWMDQQYLYADSPALLEEKKYWQQLEATPVPLILKELQTTGERVFDVLEATLSAEKTATLLEMINADLQADLNEVLLAAAGLALNQLTGNEKILLAMEGHGREDILKDADVSRTVGWFTTTYPLLLDIVKPQEPLAQLQLVKTAFRKIPNKGIGYGILKHLTSAQHKTDISFHLRPQITFNYLGQFDSDLNNLSMRIVSGPVGKMKSDHHKGAYDLEIKALISAGKLQLSAAYCRNDYRPQTIKTLLDSCLQALDNMMAATKNDKTACQTADFGFKQLSVQDLESLFD